MGGSGSRGCVMVEGFPKILACHGFRVWGVFGGLSFERFFKQKQQRICCLVRILL